MAFQRRIDRARVAGCDDDIDDVLLELGREVQVQDVHARLHDRGCAELFGRLEGVALAGLRLVAIEYENAALVPGCRVADLHVQQETIELGFGQRVGAFLLDRVLGRHDHEQALERIGLVADRDLAFLHGFEQGRLHLRRRAVDLVGQDQVMEQRALAKFERAFLRPVDVRARQVGRQQVGRELQAVEVALDALGQHLNRARLGEAGRALDKQVSVAQQRDQHAIDQVRLPDNQAAGVRFELLKMVRDAH